MAGLWEPVSGVYWSVVPTVWNDLSWLSRLGDSSLFTTVFGALAGAFAGAWAAQRIAKNGKRRDELNAEIRVVNACITLALSVLNSALSAKKQYIRPVKEQYDAEREKYLKALSAPPASEEVSIRFNLLRFPKFGMPAEQLQSLVLQQGSTQALRAVVALVEANSLLNEAVDFRNVWLEKFERKQLPPGYSYPEIYFGVVLSGGRHDQFGSTMAAIYLYSDDVIAYSLKLCGYLGEYGESLKAEFKHLSDEPIGIIQVDPQRVADSGLLPVMKEYEDWDKGYEEVRKSVSRLKWFGWTRR